MPLRKTRSVQQRMTTIIFMISMLVMLMTSAQFVFVQFKQMRSVALEDLVALSHLVSANTRLPLAVNDYLSAKPILDSLAVHKNVVSAYLLKPDGKAYISFSRAQSSYERIDSAEELKFIELESRQIEEGVRSGTEQVWQENGRLAHFLPITYEGSHVGNSFVSIELAGLRQQELLLALGWLLSMGAGVFLTAILSSRLQRHITRPVEELVARMGQISREKRLVGFLPQETDDEFKQLFNGFDEMMRALKERDRLLERHRKNLELEVQVRTRALESEKERAEQATAAKSRFLANMSHEIRTPMIGVLGMADVLKQRPLNEQDRQLVATIYQSGEALLTILNDLLDFSKIEAGYMQLDLVPFDFVQLIEDVSILMRVAAHDKGLELSVDTSQDVLEVNGDPGRLRQVLLNLVGNAIKFTDSGKVSVSLVSSSRPDAGLCDCLVVVKDTGIGISKDVQSKVFDSFDQGDSGTTRKYGGTGLGLAITRELVHLMNGEISVDSTLGQGSTFSVKLTMAIASQPDVSAVNTQQVPDRIPFVAEDPLVDAPVPARGRRHVLLAEDNPTTQSLISILLRQLGVELSVVDNGQAAIDFLAHETVDLVLMDCQMPLMDGFRATALLRERGVTTPIIALTAFARAEDEEQCRSAGMNDFLSKPFRQSELKDILLRWLGDEAFSRVGITKSVNG